MKLFNRLHLLYKTKQIFFYISITIIIIFIFIIVIASLRTDRVTQKHYDLNKDGICLIKTSILETDIENIKSLCEKKDYKNAKKALLENPRLNEIIKEKAGKNYVFQDYIWIIKKSSVHTCHRDNNGDFFNENQRHPSYTMLVYFEEMEKCLGVIPESHKIPGSFGVNFTDPVVNIICNSGDAILFNANLIHVGTINNKNDNLRIQIKVSHKDDLDALSYYQDFNKIANVDNNIPKNILVIQKNISCMVPFFSDLTQDENIKTARGSSNGAEIGIFQRIFSFIFYGNSEFYDLPDAL